MKTKHEVENSRVYLMDCMEFMKDLPDGYFNLACVDPPYGIGASYTIKYSKATFTKYKPKKWDDDIPDENYFTELIRVSKNQIIWGGNYFTCFLPPSPKWIVWDKKIPKGMSLSSHELAWTSFNSAKETMYRQSASWANGGDSKNTANMSKDRKRMGRIHPTQKPIKLYQWIFKNYLPDGGKVFDSHLGSGSSRIAADKAGNIDFTGTEIDEDYFKASVDRFNKYKSQLTLF